MKILFVFLLVIFPLTPWAEIYKCVDENGKVRFSDNNCDPKGGTSEVISPEITNLSNSGDIELDDTELEVIYEGNRFGIESRFLRVSIYEETDTYIIFFIEGYYNKPYGGKAEFRVSPNMHWSSRIFYTTDKGYVSGYGRVGLSTSSEDNVESDVITLQLWEYRNGKSQGPLETKVIPYKKKWQRKTE